MRYKEALYINQRGRAIRGRCATDIGSASHRGANASVNFPRYLATCHLRPLLRPVRNGVSRWKLSILGVLYIQTGKVIFADRPNPYIRSWRNSYCERMTSRIHPFGDQRPMIRIAESIVNKHDTRRLGYLWARYLIARGRGQLTRGARCVERGEKLRIKQTSAKGSAGRSLAVRPGNLRNRNRGYSPWVRADSSQRIRRLDSRGRCTPAEVLAGTYARISRIGDRRCVIFATVRTN